MVVEDDEMVLVVVDVRVSVDDEMVDCVLSLDDVVVDDERLR